MTQQTDADLIREATETAAAMKASGQTFTAELLRRAVARIEELTQLGEVVDTVSEFERGRRAGITEVHDAIARQKAEQPAPLALSPEDAQWWGAAVSGAKGGAKFMVVTGGAILAVDKLLRQRVQRLTDADIFAKAEATLTRIQRDDWSATDADVLEFARAVEAKLIGEGAK